MTPLEALIVLHGYGKKSYRGRAVDLIVSKARKQLDDASDEIMRREIGYLCTVCWGDGFEHRPPATLTGPCKACSGTGQRGLQKKSPEVLGRVD